MAIFADTNTLIHFLYPKDTQYPIIGSIVPKLHGQEEEIVIAPQNLIEFWAVATRPLQYNGLGLTTERASIEVARLKLFCEVLPYKMEVFEMWQKLVIIHNIIGKQAHDAHLVAFMHVYDINKIMTSNVSDFSRFPGITVIDPAQV